MHHMDAQMDCYVRGIMLEHYQRHTPMLANICRVKDVMSTMQNDLLHECIDNAIVSFLTDFGRVLMQLLGTDIENSLFKYRVNHRHLTFMIERIELLMKSSEKFDLLFVHVRCATACSLEKVNFKV